MWYKISGDVSGYVYASYLVPAGEYQQASNSNSDTGANIGRLAFFGRKVRGWEAALF